MGGEIRINCSWITVFAAYYFYRSDVAFSFGTGVFLSTMVDAVPIIHGFSWRTFYMELSMTPFKQKIMAVAAFDEQREWLLLADAMKKFGHDAIKSYPAAKVGAFAERGRLAPLLTRLVDEVEALKAALEFYAKDENYHGPNQNAVEGEPSRPGGFRLDVTFDCGFFAREAIDAHQKRWEDLK